MTRWLIALFALLTILGASAARADSWLPPSVERYESANGSYRLTVTPRMLRDQLSYFEDKVAGKEPAGQAQGETATTARAVLERRDAGGTWSQVWAAPLVNEVAPVRALVANDGRHVVTFDNWHSVGFGPDVVVIYGPDGQHIRALGLRDLLPQEYIRALPRSASSLHWGGEHRLSPDGTRLILAIVVPDDGEALFERDKESIEIGVDLSSGAPIPPAGAAWERALSKAREVTKARDAAAATWRAAFVAPLLSPTTPGEREWHRYLREALYRIEPGSELRLTVTKVLGSPAEKDYEASEKRLRAAFAEADGDASLAIAAPGRPAHLLELIERDTAKIGPGKLTGARIYVAIPAAWKDRVAAALAPTGATFIHLDPAVPIPQRPERIERLRKSEAEAAAEGA